MPFDPNTREVTMVFYELGKGAHDKPVYRRAGFDFVSYDGDPDRHMEPVNASTVLDTLGTSCTIYRTPAQSERVVGFEFLRGRLSEVAAFSPDNVDVS